MNFLAENVKGAQSVSIEEYIHDIFFHLATLSFCPVCRWWFGISRVLGVQDQSFFPGLQELT